MKAAVMPTLQAQVARIAGTAWHQWRNQRSPWTALLLVAPALPVVFALPGAGPGAAPGEVVAAVALVVAATVAVMAIGASWLLVVASVLEQNDPVAARLVPGHVHGLRCTLLGVAAVLCAPAALGLELATGSLSAAVAIVAGLLATTAAGLRWTWLWIPLSIVPGLAPSWLRGEQGAAALAWLRGAWQAAPATAAATVVVAAALVLVALVQAGGARHAERHARRARQRARESAGLREPGQPRSRLAERLAAPVGRAYDAWFDRLVARRAAPMARLMLGLGQDAHWTTQAARAAFALVATVLVAAAVGASPLAGSLPGMLAGFAFGAVLLVGLPALHARLRLGASRREQALLVLLPGVPCGAALSRALGTRLVAQFAAFWFVGVAAMRGLEAVADALSPGVVPATLGPMPATLALACLPLAPVLLARRWAGVVAPTTRTRTVDTFLPMVLAAPGWELQRLGWLTLAQCGAFYVVLAVLGLAWRWVRVAREPAPLPMGRSAP